jgi:hypothetical protein
MADPDAPFRHWLERCHIDIEFGNVISQAESMFEPVGEGGELGGLQTQGLSPISCEIGSALEDGPMARRDGERTA